MLLNSEAFTGADARVEVFFEQAPSASLIHLAMHADFNADAPLFSRLLFAQEGAPLELREVYSLDLRATDLVVLSACETQVGSATQGDEISSLNRAFLYAGASTIIASLWKVDDEATKLLMTHFYAALQQGAGKAQALQLAQAAVRTDERFAAPFYWSGFVLTGAPGVVKSGVSIVPTVSAPLSQAQPADVSSSPAPPGDAVPRLWLLVACGLGIVAVLGIMWVRTRSP
jgi:CHAT domain-containing protein